MPDFLKRIQSAATAARQTVELQASEETSHYLRFPITLIDEISSMGEREDLDESILADLEEVKRLSTIYVSFPVNRVTKDGELLGLNYGNVSLYQGGPSKEEGGRCIASRSKPSTEIVAIWLSLPAAMDAAESISQEMGGKLDLSSVITQVMSERASRKQKFEWEVANGYRDPKTGRRSRRNNRNNRNFGNNQQSTDKPSTGQQSPQPGFTGAAGDDVGEF